MSDEKNESGDLNPDDLKAFEEALAAVRPRNDRLDRGWRTLLAKEASLTMSLRAASGGTGPFFGSEASLADKPLAKNMDLSPSAEPRRTKLGKVPCESPAGHQFLCVYCGRAAPTGSGVRRWAWPAAFSAMTTVAATLLVLLVVHHEPQVAEHGPHPGVAPTVPLPSIAERTSTLPGLDQGLLWERRWAMRNVSRPLRVASSDNMSYLDLRNQVLLFGMDSWKPATPAAAPAKAAEKPLTYREQLDRLLTEENHAG